MNKSDSEPSLLREFPKPSYEDWHKAAEEALKGAPFDKKMLTPTAEGITLQPIYNELPEKDASLPGIDPFVRGTRASGYISQTWDTAQTLTTCEPEAFNALALEDLNRGQTALYIPLDKAAQTGTGKHKCCGGKGNGGLTLLYASDVETALKGVDLKAAPLYFQSGANAAGVAAILYAGVEKLGFKAADLKGTLGADPIGLLAAKGSLETSADIALGEAAKVAAYNAQKAPAFAAFAVNTLPYNQAGANAVEELAAALATGVEYLRACVNAGLSADEAAAQIVFDLSIGPKFFMEIAKFRAARLVWARAAEAFGAKADAAKLRILARTGLYNKTVNDPYVNLLRTTTEAFSAVVGGVDSLTVGAFDEIIRSADEFSRRISRNQSLILGEECDLRHVVDPSGGSYYIEAITKEIATRAWALFQEIEKQGGILPALKAGFVQGHIAKTAAERIKKFNQRRETLVGTNLYPNLAEKPLEKPDCCCGSKENAGTARIEAVLAKADHAVIAKGLSKGDLDSLIAAAKAGADAGQIFAALAKGADKAEVAALPQGRMAAAYEALRTAAEAYKANTGKAPAIFLATMGPLREHKARADFTRGFFQAGGFNIIYPKGFDSNEAAVKAAVESGAPAVVICSIDDNYPTLVPALTQALKAANPKLRVILAGAPAPEHEAAYKAAGLDDSISIRSNHFETLKNLLTFMGVIA